jgi:pyruvate dehydrogenase E2 component (dihydrolipoamide acetyltransferase)
LADNPENSIRLTHIQRLIGRRMLESKRTKPCFYLESKADVTELMNQRSALRKSLGVKITTNAFYIHSLAAAVKQFPLMVGMPEGKNIKIAESVNVGFAVAAPQGLVVPVLKNAERKTLAQIAIEEKELTDKARSNRLSIDDVQGETIGLSNLGAYDIDSFIGIVPPPASTILAVGNIIPSVVSIEGEPAVRKMLSLSLAADSRIITPVYAAKFLRQVAKLLQELNQLI